MTPAFEALFGLGLCELVAPMGLATSALGDDLPLPPPVSVAARLLVRMKLGMNELLGEVGETAAGVGRGEPLGDRPPKGEFGKGI